MPVLRSISLSWVSFCHQIGFSFCFGLIVTFADEKVKLIKWVNLLIFTFIYLIVLVVWLAFSIINFVLDTWIVHLYILFNFLMLFWLLLLFWPRIHANYDICICRRKRYEKTCIIKELWLHFLIWFDKGALTCSSYSTWCICEPIWLRCWNVLGVGLQRFSML